MSSVAKAKCWMCPETFSSHKDLKNHAASSKHSAMRVICPWCLEDEHTYRTSAELLKHVDKRHQYVTEDMKRGDFFSEKNGYWLALKPEEYKRVVTPTDYHSTEAMKTRSIVGRWLDKVRKDPSRSRDQWTNGWEIMKPKETTQVYNPTDPGFSTPEVKVKLVNLELSPKGHIAYLIDEGATIGDVWYQAHFSQEVLSDRKASEGLLRRMGMLTTGRTIPGYFNKLVGDVHGVTTAVAKELGIPNRFIGKIYRQIVSFSVVAKKRKLQCLADELGVVDDVEIKEPTENDQKAKELKRAKPPAKELTPAEPSAKEVTPTTPPSEEAESAKAPAEEQRTSPDDSPRRSESIFTKVVEKLVTPIKDTATASHLTATPPGRNNEIIIVAEVHDEPQNNTSHTEREAEVHQEPQNYRSVAEKAYDLLSTGIMPLLPPARREWTDVEPLELIRTAKTTIIWPPQDWNDMSDEEKLTAWTYTAMALEMERGVGLIKDNGELLDRYAFLALPGTLVSRTDRNPTANVRLSNYNILRDICLGEITGDEAHKWVKVFRGAKQGADVSALHVLDKIRHIPLRLRSDSTDTSAKEN